MTRAVDPVAGHTADNGAQADADTAGARPHTASHADDDPDGRASRYGTGVERIRSFTGVAPERAFDHDKLRAGVRLLLEGLGIDPSDPTIAGTPERVARMFDEVFAGLLVDPSEVLDVLFEEGHDELVLIRDIPFASMCEHHLVPFIGQAHVGYIPNTSGQVTGLSKLARLVDLVAKRPNLQERITTQIADIVEDALAPRGVIVVIEAEHLCMSMRGVRKPGAITVTSAVRGVMRDDPATRAEAMSLAVGASGSSVR